MTAPYPQLTAGELRLLGLLADTDLTHEAIARDLGVPVTTVRARAADLYALLGFVSRKHLRSVLLECELAAAGS